MNPAPIQSYDVKLNILYVSHPAPVRLDTREQIRAYFDRIVSFWQLTCAGRKAYYLVDWTDFTTNMVENSYYAEQVKRVVDDCAIAIVRYTDNPMQRAAGRLAAIKMHKPSNIYETRDEALKVIEALRSGKLRAG